MVIVKKFRQYIPRNKVFAIVFDPTVKLLLMQNEMGECRAKWMNMLQEYDIEIQPIQLVRGKGLMRKMVVMGPDLAA